MYIIANEKPSGIEGESGADERIRTADLRITNALLYQLSYVGIARQQGAVLPLFKSTLTECLLSDLAKTQFLFPINATSAEFERATPAR